MTSNPNKIISLQELINAQVDAKVLELIMNEAPLVEVETRLGRKCYSISTIQAIIDQYKLQADQELDNLRDAIEIAAAAGAGANGWTDNLVQTWTGRNQQQKNKELLSVYDFDKTITAIQSAIKSSSLLLLNNTAFTINVGVMGDFKKLSDALSQASKMKILYDNENNGLIEIKLLSGFILDEQIIVRDGQDLSFCVIRSEDQVVPIFENPSYPDFAELDANNSIFIAYNNAVLPILGTKFRFEDVGISDGIAVIKGSKVLFEPGAGIYGCRNGLKVLYGSEAYCYMQGLTIGGGSDDQADNNTIGVQFPGCSNRGLHVAYGSRVGLARSNFTECGGYGAYVIWNGFADLYQSDFARNKSTDAVYVRDGSIVCLREASVSDCVGNGLHVLHGAIVDARSRISAESSVDVNWHPWVKRGYRNNGGRGVFASYGGVIEAAEACVDGAGTMGVGASNGSTIIFTDGSAKNCSSHGIYAEYSSTVSARNADVSGSVNGAYVVNSSILSIDNGNANNCKVGIHAGIGSNISFSNGNANNCHEKGIFAEHGSVVVANYASAQYTKRGVESNSATVICKRINASNCTERGLSAIDGGEINAYNSIISFSNGFAVTARNGSKVNITGSDLGDKTPNCQTGSTVIAHNFVTTTTDLNTYNVISTNGVIYK